MFGVFMAVFCVLTVEILQGVIPCVTNEGVREAVTLRCCWIYLTSCISLDTDSLLSCMVFGLIN
jgi:hypothetical protein